MTRNHDRLETWQKATFDLEAIENATKGLATGLRDLVAADEEPAGDAE